MEFFDNDILMQERPQRLCMPSEQHKHTYIRQGMEPQKNTAVLYLKTTQSARGLTTLAMHHISAFHAMQVRVTF